MMRINRREKLRTIGFCQANKNRNVSPVRVDTDQSSLSVSHWLAFSVSLLAETHFDNLKGRLCFFHYSNISEFDISVRPEHPLYVMWWPCLHEENQHPECTETFMLGYFYFKEFFLFFVLLNFWCNIVQIHPAELFINWNKVTERRSEWASSYKLKHLWPSILCVCVFCNLGKRPYSIVLLTLVKTLRTRK